MQNLQAGYCPAYTSVIPVLKPSSDCALSWLGGMSSQLTLMQSWGITQRCFKFNTQCQKVTPHNMLNIPQAMQKHCSHSKQGWAPQISEDQSHSHQLQELVYNSKRRALLILHCWHQCCSAGRRLMALVQLQGSTLAVKTLIKTAG